MAGTRWAATAGSEPLIAAGAGLGQPETER